MDPHILLGSCNDISHNVTHLWSSSIHIMLESALKCYHTSAKLGLSGCTNEFIVCLSQSEAPLQMFWPNMSVHVVILLNLPNSSFILKCKFNDQFSVVILL